MTSQLKHRIAFTLGALFVYRLAAYIPLPGIDPAAWTVIFNAHTGGVLGELNLLSGGAIRRLGIVALNITPYVSAAVILQIAMLASRRLRAPKDRGERGRQTIELRTRYLTVLLAAIQAYGIAVGLERVDDLISDPGWPFIVSTVITLTGGSMFLVWLSEQITLRGIGNGIALVLVAGIVTELPETIDFTLQLGNHGKLSDKLMLAIPAIIVGVTGFVVLMERARRRIPIRYAERQVGSRLIEGVSTDLSLKLNSAGVIPPVLIAWFLPVLIVLATLAGEHGPAWLKPIVALLEYGEPLYLIVYAMLIVLCAFLYTAFVFDPEESADNLKRYGGSIPALEPGEATAGYIDHVLSRITVIGAGYLTLVCLLPVVLAGYTGMPFNFGGPSLLIVVCATLDIEAQVRRWSAPADPGSPSTP